MSYWRDIMSIQNYFDILQEKLQACRETQSENIEKAAEMIVQSQLKGGNFDNIRWNRSFSCSFLPWNGEIIKRRMSNQNQVLLLAVVLLLRFIEQLLNAYQIKRQCTIGWYTLSLL